MTQRTWFTADTCPTLTVGDLGILNRATRRLIDVYGVSDKLMLMHVRGDYQPGMSALELSDHVARRYSHKVPRSLR